SVQGPPIGPWLLALLPFSDRPLTQLALPFLGRLSLTRPPPKGSLFGTPPAFGKRRRQLLSATTCVFNERRTVMLRRFLFLSVGAVVLLGMLGTPGQLHARPMRGVFPNMVRPGFQGGMMPG